MLLNYKVRTDKTIKKNLVRNYNINKKYIIKLVCYIDFFLLIQILKG
jgi:hypothetical protein